jgi:hypothetical protein
VVARDLAARLIERFTRHPAASLLSCAAAGDEQPEGIPF